MSAKAVVEISMVCFRRMLRWVALVAGRRAPTAVPAEDLIDAACRGDAAAVQALLAKGADINARMSGGTALIMASQWGHLDVVQALLAKGADLNAKWRYGTALDAATAGGHADVRALLVQAGAKP